MRSRAPILKWKSHLGHTFRFSSSSLSKTIVPHFSHLVQRPSGMSRFLDLPPEGFGFLTNFVSVVDTGGVTAGSAVSRPSDFFVKLVVVMGEWQGYDSWLMRDSGPSAQIPDWLSNV